MITAKEYLDKIKWDTKLNPKEFSVHYYDRVEGKLKEVKFSGIKEIGQTFFTVEKDDEDADIPIHRVKEIRRNGKLVWERTSRHDKHAQHL